MYRGPASRRQINSCQKENKSSQKLQLYWIKEKTVLESAYWWIYFGEELVEPSLLYMNHFSYLIKNKVKIRSNTLTCVFITFRDFDPPPSGTTQLSAQGSCAYRLQLKCAQSAERLLRHKLRKVWVRYVTQCFSLKDWHSLWVVAIKLFAMRCLA